MNHNSITLDLGTTVADDIRIIVNNIEYALTPVGNSTADSQRPSMSDAINIPAWINVAWNNDKGIDLREYVNTHRDANTTNCKVWDTNAAAGLVEKSGFKYNFELIGYHVGDNTTSQSAHGAIKYDENTKEWNYRPSLTNNGKQQPWGYTQSQSTVGREPIVRVQLVDTVNNKVACVGYIKIAIVATTPATPKPNELVLNPGANEPYTIHCGDDNMDLLKITWWQVEEQIMHKVGLSKDDFEANYGLVKNGTATAIATARTTAGALDDLDQFKVSQDNNGDYTITNLTGANKIGSISQTKLDAADNETEVLYWSIKFSEAHQNEVKVKGIIAHAEGDRPEITTDFYFKPVDHLNGWHLTMVNSRDGDVRLISNAKTDSMQQRFQQELEMKKAANQQQQ